MLKLKKIRFRPISKIKRFFDNQKARKIIKSSHLFDKEFYSRMYPDIGVVDPLTHYIKRGALEGRQASPRFDSGWYLSAYQDVAQSRINPLIHYIKHGHLEGRKPTASYNNADIANETVLQIKRGKLNTPPHIIAAAERIYTHLSSIESEIAGEIRFKSIDQLPVSYALNKNNFSQIWSQIFRSINSQYSHFIFVPWLVLGGADLVAVNAIKLAIEKHGADKVLLVVTDHDRMDAKSWLPRGVHICVFSDYDPHLSHEERVTLVESMIFALKPKSILNVNSRACWDAIKRRGAALSNITNIYTCLFCRDYAPDGRPGGYSDTHFIHSIEYTVRIYLDNFDFIDFLTNYYQLPRVFKEKLTLLLQPANHSIKKSGFSKERLTNKKVPVLWAGRLCKQKNIDLLLEVVGKSPHIQFDIYGYEEKGSGFLKKIEILQNKVDNLKFKGSFKGISELQTQNYAAYLFTSLWEGLPTSLIELAAKGIPIVASDVGGVSNLINHKTGWLIKDYKLADPYIEALNEIKNNPEKAQEKVTFLLENISKNHSWESYKKAFLQSPSFLD